jgi:hypothetical protein
LTTRATPVAENFLHKDLHLYYTSNNTASFEMKIQQKLSIERMPKRNGDPSITGSGTFCIGLRAVKIALICDPM